MKRTKNLIKIYSAGFAGLFVVIILFTAGCLKGQGNVEIVQGETQRVFSFSGIINKDTVWNGVIQIEDDVLVPAGVVLTIQSGAKIVIREKDSSKNEPLFLSAYNEIVIRGKVIAMGKEDDPIIFSGEGKSKDGIFWAGIILDHAEEAIFKFCKIQNAFTGIDSIRSSPVIEENIFINNKYAVISSGENSYPKINRNIIKENYAGFYGIFYSRGELAGNKIENNEEEGIFTGHGSDITLKNNSFNKNKYDIKRD